MPKPPASHPAPHPAPDAVRALSRTERDLSAHDFARTNSGRLAALLTTVVDDLAEEVGELGLSQREADNRLAAEMAYRLDRATDWTEIIPAGKIGTPVGLVLEALDWFGYWLAAQGVIAAWRRLERRQPALRGRLEKLAGLLASDSLLPLRRKRLERRAARLTRLTAAG